MGGDHLDSVENPSHNRIELFKHPRPYGSTFLGTGVHIIFVLGGPGAGKGTQCVKLAQDFHIQHLSVGDVLREERDTAGSEYGKLIACNMEAGRIGPMEVTVTLLERAMRAAFVKHKTKVFLIDGFPRKMDQLQLFESTIDRAAFALFLDSPEETRLLRLLKCRAIQNRQDDSFDIVQRRFDTFNNVCMIVVTYLEGEGRLKRINAEASEEEVYTEIQRTLIMSFDLDLIRK